MRAGAVFWLRAGLSPLCSARPTKPSTPPTLASGTLVDGFGAGQRLAALEQGLEVGQEMRPTLVDHLQYGAPRFEAVVHDGQLDHVNGPAGVPAEVRPELVPTGVT